MQHRRWLRSPCNTLRQLAVSGAAQVEGFIGADAQMRSWEQKQALLLALRPRDRLRLLGLVRAARPPCCAAPRALKLCTVASAVLHAICPWPARSGRSKSHAMHPLPMAAAVNSAFT